MQTQNSTITTMRQQTIDLKPIIAQLHDLERQHRTKAQTPDRIESAKHAGRQSGYNRARYDLKRAKSVEDAIRRLDFAIEQYAGAAEGLSERPAVTAWGNVFALQHAIECVKAATGMGEFAELYAWVDAQPPATDEAQTIDELCSMRQDDYESSAPLAQWQQ